MKKLILLLFLFFVPTNAFAQCNGSFPAGTYCGSVPGGPPGPIPYIVLPLSVANGGTACSVASGTCLDNITGFGATGVFVRGGAGSYLARTLTGGGGITITNGSGVAGNPTFQLSTGTQDTVLGYFSSTTASAATMPNCTGALTYSTGTHTFSCNATAGTGNVVNSGTPAANQIAQWTNATTIQGVNIASLLSAGTFVTITGTTTATINVTAASKADQITGTSNIVAVAPLHQQDHDSAAKAWITFAGSTGTSTASYNASSSRSSAGSYVVTFGTAFSSANYSCQVTSSGASGGFIGNISSKSAGSVTVNTLTTAPIGADATGNVDVVCYGRQ